MRLHAFTLEGETRKAEDEQQAARRLRHALQATRQTRGTNYQTVSEPTSGLLMLLGMAGLALRRRRA